MPFKIFNFKQTTIGGTLIHLGLALLAFFALAIAYFYVYLPSITNHNESITVPSIEGLHIDELNQTLGSRNLDWEINDSSYAEDQLPLTVLKQFPKAGSKVKENRKIFISVNRIKPPTVPLPNLEDRSVENAEAVLKSTELRRGNITRIPGPWLDVVQEMRYKGKPLKAGTRIPKGSVVDLVVMDGGSDSVTLPRLIGEEVEDAKFIILGKNLSLGKITLLGDTTGRHPIVIKQKPQSFSTMRVGDIVDLWVGPEGMTLDEEHDIEDLD